MATPKMSYEMDVNAHKQIADHEGDLISKRSEIFRSKLIEDFHLLDSIDERGGLETPRFYSDDVPKEGEIRRMMKEAPNALVRFHAYSSGDKHAISYAERRMNRVKNKNSNYPPLDMWAHWVIASDWFQNSILILILSNSVVLGIQGEIADIRDTDLSVFRTILNVFDYCTLLIFVVEIILKWIDNFGLFWKNGGNIIDFLITFLSIVPEIINMFLAGNAEQASGIGVIADTLRVFRITRSLKMVTRFRQVRLIALAVAKAFQAMVFISLLLMTFLYIFAIVGVMFFRTHAQTQNPDLHHQSSFKSLYAAMITLFQLLTLDGWRDILDDLLKVSDPIFTGFYIIIWIIISSFIFKNIFVGIMVNNFQSIRSDLFEDVREIEEAKNAQRKLEKLNEELAKHDQQFHHKHDGDSHHQRESKTEVIQSTWSTDIPPPETLGTANQTDDQPEQPEAQPEYEVPLQDPTLEEYENVVSQHMLHITQSSNDWQRTLMDNLDTISKTPIETAWPRDTLFCYLLLMESLMENIEERKELLELAAEALLQIHDT